jgi:hypothetical protein
LLTFYREHWIIMLIDEFLSAEITDRATGAPYPTKVSATFEEGEDVLIERARALVDMMLVELEGRDVRALHQ